MKVMRFKVANKGEMVGRLSELYRDLSYSHVSVMSVHVAPDVYAGAGLILIDTSLRIDSGREVRVNEAGWLAHGYVEVVLSDPAER